MQVVLDGRVTLRCVFMRVEKFPLLARLKAFFPIYRESYRDVPTEGCTSEDFAHSHRFGKPLRLLDQSDLERHQSLRRRIRPSGQEIVVEARLVPEGGVISRICDNRPGMDAKTQKPSFKGFFSTKGT